MGNILWFSILCIFCLNCKQINKSIHVTELKTYYTEDDAKKDRGVKGYSYKLVGRALMKNFTSFPDNSVTKIKYQNTLEIQNELVKTTAIRDFDIKDQQYSIDGIRTYYLGGSITLEIDRPEPFNMAWFSIIVKDLKEKSIYRKDLLPDDLLKPTYHKSTKNWSNLQSTNIPVFVRPPFFIYIEDRRFGGLYKFYVH